MVGITCNYKVKLNKAPHGVVQKWILIYLIAALIYNFPYKLYISHINVVSVIDSNMNAFMIGLTILVNMIMLHSLSISEG
jgi:hypothetical protein